MNRTDQKLKKLAHLVADLAETVRDARIQTAKGDVVSLAPSAERDLTQIAEEAMQIGGRRGETL